MLNQIVKYLLHQAKPGPIWLRRKHSFWKNAFHLRTKEACVPRKLSDFSLGSVHRDVYHIFSLFQSFVFTFIFSFTSVHSVNHIFSLFPFLQWIRSPPKVRGADCRCDIRQKQHLQSIVKFIPLQSYFFMCVLIQWKKYNIIIFTSNVRKDNKEKILKWKLFEKHTHLIGDRGRLVIIQIWFRKLNTYSNVLKHYGAKEKRRQICGGGVFFRKLEQLERKSLVGKLQCFYKNGWNLTLETHKTPKIIWF